MAFPKVPEDRLRAVVALVEGTFADGFEPGRGANAEATRRGMKSGLVTNHIQVFRDLELARERLGLEPDESLYRPRRYQAQPPGLPVVPPQDHLAEPEPEGEPYELLAIGDAHDSPHIRDKSRFRWIGAYAAEHGLRHIVQIGDWITLDSLSSHTDRSTFQGLAKPTFDQDLDSFHESQRAFQFGLDGHRAKLDFIEGNHEFRATRWANEHAETVGASIDPAHRIKEAFTQWGWRYTPFAQYRFLQGVGFIHAPQNAVGKSIGGKTGNQRIANDAVFDIVRGDDHKFNIACAAKHGPVKPVRVYSIGCAFPPGFIESYASTSLNDWESGVARLTIWGRRVVGFEFVGMHLLQRRYGQRWAA